MIWKETPFVDWDLVWLWFSCQEVLVSWLTSGLQQRHTESLFISAAMSQDPRTCEKQVLGPDLKPPFSGHKKEKYRRQAKDRTVSVGADILTLPHPPPDPLLMCVHISGRIVNIHYQTPLFRFHHTCTWSRHISTSGANFLNCLMNPLVSQFVDAETLVAGPLWGLLKPVPCNSACSDVSFA